MSARGRRREQDPPGLVHTLAMAGQGKLPVLALDVTAYTTRQQSFKSGDIERREATAYCTSDRNTYSSFNS